MLWLNLLVDEQLAGVTSKARNFCALVSSHLLLFCFSLCNKFLDNLFTKRLRGRCALEKPKVGKLLVINIKNSAFRVSKLHAYLESLTPWLNLLVDEQLAGVTSKARNFCALVSSHLLLFCFSLCNKFLDNLFTKRLRGRCALEKPKVGKLLVINIKNSAFRVSKLHAYLESLMLWLNLLVDAQLAGVTSKARNFSALFSSHLLLFYFSLFNKVLSNLFTKRLRGRCALEKP